MLSPEQIAVVLGLLWVPVALLWKFGWAKGRFVNDLRPVLAALCILTYFVWRAAYTIVPYLHYPDANPLWMWVVLFFEILAYTETYFLLMLRDSKIDRGKELDELIARNPGYAPSVDLLIPTYNEPIDILERTIVRAASIDYPDYVVHVLDDGRRPEVQRLCEDLGVSYRTRPDNQHAKAGNMNHVLPELQGEIIAILDADYAAHDDFLSRAVHFFKDPRVGQVQMPQGFINYDPIQMNSRKFGQIRDEQWLWFHYILVKRDAIDCATSCGSCSLVRRDALRLIGDRFPVDTVTEDYDMSLRLLEKGIITRYLDEIHAVGLAAEDMNGFLIQRKRWGLGNIKAGFLAMKRARGPDLLRLLMIFEWRYLVSFPARSFMFLVPIVYFWFGLPPLKVSSVVQILILHGSFLALTHYVERQADRYGRNGLLYSQATSALVSLGSVYSMIQQALRLEKLNFEVTPKGDLAEGRRPTGLIVMLRALIFGTVSGGTYVGLMACETGTIDATKIVALAWAAWNVLVLITATHFAQDRPRARRTERLFSRQGLSVDLTLSENGQMLARLPVLDVSEGGFLVKGQLAPGNYVARLAGMDMPLDCARVVGRAVSDPVSAFRINHDTQSRRAMFRLLYNGQFYLP